jgi:putative transposase
VTATAERLAELLARPLDQQRWLIVFLDGLGFAEHTLVGALGVVEGSTENAPYVPAWSPT